MKKIVGLVFIGILCFVVSPAQAQLRFGVKGGLNISTVHFSEDIIKPDNVTGFHIGPMLEATVPLLGVGFETAILYTQRGLEFQDETMKVDYLDVPLHLKWKFGLPIVKVYLATGPYFGFRVSGDKLWDIPGSVSNQIKAKSFSSGWDIGAGAELLNHLQVGVNYGFGFTNNYEFAGTESGKNRGWYVTAAILF